MDLAANGLLAEAFGRYVGEKYPDTQTFGNNILRQQYTLHKQAALVGWGYGKRSHHPATLVEAIRYFSDPDTCLSYLIPIRWPQGITCPHCNGAENTFVSSRRIWRCKGCKKQFSVKIGTIMEDSPLALDKWLTAIWLIANAKNGISSWELHRALGITQKSAWFLLHRIWRCRTAR